MKPVVEDIYTDARGHLHDNGGPASNQFSDSVLQPHYQRAYRKMFDAMSFGSNRIRREWYFILPANTSVLDPFAYDINDMSEPEYMEDRDVGTQLNITGFSGGFTPGSSLPITLNIPGHGLGAN